MNRTTKYVALDVHQATTVASVREESGRVIARSVLPADERVGQTQRRNVPTRDAPGCSSQCQD